MSFDIYFIKSKNVDANNVQDMLESANRAPDSELFIGHELRRQLIQAIQDLGLQFDLFESKDGHVVELTMRTYQVAIYEIQVCISLPYWAVNSQEKVKEEVQAIMNILFANGFTGFDPQSEAIIREPYGFKDNFAASKSIVDQHLRKVKKPITPVTWLWMVLGVLLAAVLIWNMIQAA